MRSVSRGYLTLQNSQVRLDPWAIALDGGSALYSPDHLDDWSYYQKLRIRVTLLVDIAEIYESLGLDDSAKLAVLIAWVSPGTSLRGVSKLFALDQTETSAELELDGGYLRGDLRLECQIVLSQGMYATETTLAPTNPGSVVWSSAHIVRLEGIGSRMPVLAVPFSRHVAAGGNHGLWWLRVGEIDMEARADSVLWMWLNDENESIQELLTTPLSDGARRTEQFMKLDLYRQLIEIGLRAEDFDLFEHYASGSLGAAISTPMRLLGANLAEIRALLENDPQRLQMIIQAALGGL